MGAAVECLMRDPVEDAEAVGVPVHVEDPGPGWHRRNDPARALRRQVAEENGRLLPRWFVPRTVAIKPSECSSPPSMFCGPCLSPLDGGKGTRLPVISFSGWNTADAVLHLASRRRCGSGSICILNFANGSSRSVGGGYRSGALAQEEDLCRRFPGLHPSLTNAKREGFYPFGPSTYRGPNNPGRYSDVLFTQDVTLARLGEKEGFQLLDPTQEVQASVISAAAPNVGFASEAVVPELMMDTVRSIFLAPKMMQPSLQVLILGAWGCGAFGGDPSQIAQLFARALADEGLGGAYSEVHFAIPAGANARAFLQTLRSSGLQPVEI